MAVHNEYPTHVDTKEYSTKVRQLIYNLKRNDQLRQKVASGECHPQHLVRMSPLDLAPEEKKNERDELGNNELDSKRSDYYKENRDKILREIGVDPDKGTEFTCKRCGSTKTTHYAMQTRSADEPMTVFVQCLKCPNRWKTN